MFWRGGKEVGLLFWGAAILVERGGGGRGEEGGLRVVVGNV